METSFEILFFISQHFGKPKLPDVLTLPDIRNVELIFTFLLWWIPDISWKYDFLENICFLRSLKYENKSNVLLNRFLKNIDLLMNIFEMLVSVNRSGFPILCFFGKKRFLQ